MTLLRFMLAGFIGLIFMVVMVAQPVAAFASGTDKDEESQTAAAADTSNAAAVQAGDDDGALNLAQPDFTVVTLPTTLRLPRYKGAFRVTHRFNRPLGVGDFGDLVADLFGLDASSLVGLEYRFGLLPGGQVGIHRTSNKTIQFFGQYRSGAPERGHARGFGRARRR